MLGAALSVCVVPPSLRAEEIPFQFSRAFGLVLIRADVNGHRAVLILDTGSNHTAINSRFVDVASPGLRDTVSTEKGSPHPARGVFTNVSLMKIGPFVWRDHRILAMDMQDLSGILGENVDGLLGMDFLNEFAMVQLDLKRHRLTFM